jgi:trehalose 6-phosphate synthase/phosphatase
MGEDRGLVVVSNRLPVVLRSDGHGHPRAEAGSGGLVTALTPVLRQRQGTWIGWTGIPQELTQPLLGELDAAGRQLGMTLRPFSLSPEEVRDYYRGFAGEVLWPLFHDLTPNCRFEESYWSGYARVNRKIAELVSQSVDPRDFVWAQDYHLIRVATEIRRLGVKNPLGFFLHVPFPAPDIFARLPWRRQILEGLLDFDIVGFQTQRDTDNFLGCVDRLAPEWSVSDIGSRRRVTSPHRSAADGEGGSVDVGSFPISIDYDEFASLAASVKVRELARRLEAYFDQQKILLGVDRLDYTKGLLLKLRGYRRALEEHPWLRQRVTLVQHVVPSRESIPRYRQLRPEIERLVSEINGEHGTLGWVPVRYFYHSLTREELCAYYRLADALLVTSIKDGMNLVAKEYCASNVGEDGVLVLSEFAGACSQLGGDALVVNPHDVEAVARAIVEAVAMEPGERHQRMQHLRHIVSESDVYHWVSSFLDSARRFERDRADDELSYSKRPTAYTSDLPASHI